MNIKKVLLIVLIIILVIDAAAIIWLKSNESEIIFDPIKEPLTPILYSDVEYNDITITTKDSVTLKGWEIYCDNSDTLTPWLIYFHDRGHFVSSNLVEYLQLRKLGMNILVVDYRGFGESEGEISEPGIYLDADAIYYYLRHKKQIPYNQIIIYGKGIGAAAVIDVGQNVNAGALVLVNPFTSAPELLQNWYPFSWPKIFAGLELNSLDKIKNINTPKIFVTIPEKSCMPSEHCDQLFNSSKKYYWRLEAEPYDGINHYNYFSGLVELLNSKARFSLGIPLYSLADTLLNTISTQGIESALRHYNDILLDADPKYDLSEYQLDYLGNKLYDENKLQEAIEIFRLNQKAFPQSCNSQNNLAKALIKAGDNNGAEKCLRESLLLNPESNPAEEMLKELTNN